MSLQSEQINELMGALSKAQGEMSHAIKDSVNPHFKSKYSDLASIWRACREPLSRNGLAVTQTLDLAGERQVLITTLGHSSGQYIKSIASLPIQKPGPQETVSCITYMRRSSLASMVGVYQDDDDGESAQSSYREPVREIPRGPRITEEQSAQLDMYLQEFPDAKKGLCEKFALSDVYDLEQKDFGFVVNVFEKRRKAKENK